MMSELLSSIFAMYAMVLLILFPSVDVTDIEFPDINIIYEEPVFNTTSIDGLEKFLEYSTINENTYNDAYNCINFSSDLITELNYYGFKTNYASLAVYQQIPHRIVYVELKNNLIFVEPYDDKILLYSEIKDYYSYYQYNQIRINYEDKSNMYYDLDIVPEFINYEV